jgi:HPt (histidine-containing phosphotransfer) domain-containing protein
LRRFRESEHDFADRFRAAVAKGDTETATRHAHSLKSVAENVGAHDVRDAAAELEWACAGPASQARREALLAVTIEHLDLVVSGLDTLDDVPDGGPTEATTAPLLEMLDELGALLEEADADAVELAHMIAKHPFGQAHAGVASRLLRHVEEYDYEAALDALRQLRDQATVEPRWRTR